MASNVIDTEIRKYLPLLGNTDKKSLLAIIKNFLHKSEINQVQDSQLSNSISIDYTKYRYPVANIKFNRDEINER